MGHRHWLNDMSWEIMADQDPPKTLDGLLRRDVKPDKRGYERHDIVEQTAARNEGYPESQIDGLDNLVLVPRYRHEKINSWVSNAKREL